MQHAYRSRGSRAVSDLQWLCSRTANPNSSMTIIASVSYIILAPTKLKLLPYQPLSPERHPCRSTRARVKCDEYSCFCRSHRFTVDKTKFPSSCEDYPYSSKPERNNIRKSTKRTFILLLCYARSLPKAPRVAYFTFLSPPKHIIITTNLPYPAGFPRIDKPPPRSPSLPRNVKI